jgi:hypothetical protein
MRRIGKGEEIFLNFFEIVAFLCGCGKEYALLHPSGENGFVPLPSSEA